jgi:hypothetical protein
MPWYELVDHAISFLFSLTSVIVPVGTFAAKGTQAIPEQFASLVPAIAFQVPDIAAMAMLQLQSKDTGEKIACIQSQVTNGKTASVPAVSFIAAGVAGVALIATGASAVSAAVAGGSAAVGGSSAGGVGTISPSFGEVFGWFQGMAMNGMLSVNYPQVYRSFAKNFGFSTGLIPWNQLQMTIDNFREATGGNTTTDNVRFLHNATLVFPDGSQQVLTKRAFSLFSLIGRQIVTSVNSTTSSTTTTGTGATPPADTTASIRLAVKGIQGYVTALSIPSPNTFMTVLLVVAIIILAITVSILLVKVILEAWALFGNFPKALAGFRKHYWGSIARAITNLIFLLYGVWVLYCVFQFTHGDSWAAKVLAGVTLGIFTAILLFFSIKIWLTARYLRESVGDTGGLYDDKTIWVKYSLFYDSYRRDYWWIFVPTIIYMFVKGFALAATDGHGMVQTIAQIVIEGVMLIVLLWSRPYERRSGNVVNIMIQVVRVISVVCILIFVEEFGIAQTTQTVAGVVLIAVQSALTGILAILIIWNVIIACCRRNPHRQRRKELGTCASSYSRDDPTNNLAEEMQRDTDNLTPLDARNSLLLDPESKAKNDTFVNTNMVQNSTPVVRAPSPQRFQNLPQDLYGYRAQSPYRPLTPVSIDQSRDNLIPNAAPLGRSDTVRSVPWEGRPNYGYGQQQAYSPPQGGYGYGGYNRAPPSRGY